MFVLTKNYLIGVLLVFLLVSCAPGGDAALQSGVEPAADADVEAQQESPSESEQAVMSTITPSEPASESNVASTDVSSAEDSVAPEATPADDQTSGQAEGSMGDVAADPAVTVDELPQVDMNVANWATYTDTTHNFTLAHPTDYVVRAADSATLTDYAPAPLAAIRVMSPVIANSDLGDLEVPQLNIRIYNAEAGSSLEDWLVGQGLISEGDNVAPTQVGLLTGVTACSSTLMWPNCSTFLMQGGKVYQLTAGDPVGEAMLQTFVIVQ